MVKHLETLMLLLILGVSTFMTQVSAQISSKDFEGLLLEIILQPSTGNPTGSRVFNDGRYEFLSDSQIVVASDGSSTRKQVPLEWREEYVFTPLELTELQEAMTDANLPSLEAVYPPSGQTFNTSTMTWRVLVNGQVKQIVVEGYPINKVPALEILYQRFNQIHKAPTASSVWNVWTSAGVVQRTIEGDVSSFDFLRPVIQALFTPNPNSNNAGMLALEPQTIILEIEWLEEGQEFERTRLYADGRYVELTGDSEKLVTTLSLPQLLDLLDVLETIRWDQLPEPVTAQLVIK
jgi:hypothetical protein